MEGEESTDTLLGALSGDWNVREMIETEQEKSCVMSAVHSRSRPVFLLYLWALRWLSLLRVPIRSFTCPFHSIPLSL